jgi:hypothetical protein
MERKLATIRTINNLEPIDGKDLIELATLDGWQAIVKKGEYSIGDLVVYCEIDSFLPVREEYEFLRSRCFKSTKNLGDGFRIKSMKMGGVLSQGLVLPLSIMGKNNYLKGFIPPNKWVKDITNWQINGRGVFVAHEVGSDCTEFLDIQKYEKPIPANLAGKVRGNFPSFIPKTDQERIQNCFPTLQNKYMEYTWERTVKLDGSSMTIYCNLTEISHEGCGRLWYHEGVCSRNLDLKIEDNDGNAFVEMWKQLHGSIYHYCVSYNRPLAFQGEIMGSGIQGNREQLTEHTFYCYDIFDIKKQEYLSSKERLEILS